jgi:hypothetical protein
MESIKANKTKRPLTSPKHNTFRQRVAAARTYIREAGRVEEMRAFMVLLTSFIR